MYKITEPNGAVTMRDTIPQAVTHAARNLYIHPQRMPDLIEILEKGEAATLSYGFAQVTIEPVEESPA